ncbi:hypothetical protein BDR05DRAFT_891570, partial [Suillus weaverae]
VPVTRALSTSVETGQYPETRTTVMKCVTSLGHSRRVSGGVETPEYKRVAFVRIQRPCEGALADIHYLTDVVRVSLKILPSKI